MKLTQLITINAILAIAFGIAFGVYGPIMMAFFNVPETPGGTADLYWSCLSPACMAQRYLVSGFCCGLSEVLSRNQR